MAERANSLPPRPSDESDSAAGDPADPIADTEADATAGDAGGSPDDESEDEALHVIARLLNEETEAVHEAHDELVYLEEDDEE